MRRNSLGRFGDLLGMGERMAGQCKLYRVYSTGVVSYLMQNLFGNCFPNKKFVLNFYNFIIEVIHYFIIT